MDKSGVKSRNSIGMRKSMLALCILVSLLGGDCVNSQNHFPANLNEHAFEHIHYLSTQIGERVSSTTAEANAASYIKRQLESIGIETEIEEFSFETYKVDSVVVRIAGSKYSAKKHTSTRMIPPISSKVVACR